MIYLFRMRRIIAVFSGLAVSACASAPAPVLAQRPAQDAPRTLHVSAQATVTRAPDRAVIQLAVETLAATAQAATAGNAESMAAVLEALDGLGIERSAVQTRSLSLNPRYDRRPDAEPTIVAYQALNQVSVRVDGVHRVGPAVDAAVGAGANRVTGIRFELSDPEAAYHEALERAIAQARREAEVAAAALGESLGPALEVSTGGFDAPTPQRSAPQMMRAEAATPVEPGELEVRAHVSITYRLGT